MQRLMHVLSVVLVLGVAACQEDLTAPGACPAFCPTTSLEVFDSVLSGAFTSDTTFRGYVPPWLGGAMPVAGGSGTVVSYGLVRFAEFIDSLRPTGGGDPRPVTAVDSFRLRVFVRRWSKTAGLSLNVHRLPVSVDTTTQFADIAPLFADSTLIGTIAVPQDTILGDSLTLTLPTTAFPDFRGADSLTIAVGFALTAPQPAYTDVRSSEAAAPPSITRFAKILLADSSTSEVSDARSALVDTYVFDGVPPAGAGVLLAGGVPSARSFLEFALPNRILLESDVLRATLLLVPAEPVAGAPGDTLLVRAEQLLANFGAKSPFNQQPSDSIGGRRVVVGSSDTVRIDITHILRAFRQDSLLPRFVLIRLQREGGTFGEFRFHGSGSAGLGPAMHLTWSPLPGREGS